MERKEIKIERKNKTNPIPREGIATKICKLQGIDRQHAYASKHRFGIEIACNHDKLYLVFESQLSGALEKKSSHG